MESVSRASMNFTSKGSDVSALAFFAISVGSSQRSMGSISPIRSPFTTNDGISPRAESSHASAIFLIFVSIPKVSRMRFPPHSAERQFTDSCMGYKSSFSIGIPSFEDRSLHKKAPHFFFETAALFVFNSFWSLSMTQRRLR